MKKTLVATPVRTEQETPFGRHRVGMLGIKCGPMIPMPCEPSNSDPFAALGQGGSPRPIS